MKKIVYLSLILIFLIPFSHAFANDTDLYILTELQQQAPPDALILLDLSGSMTNTPADQTSYTVYYNQGTPTTTCTNNCGDPVEYYSTNTGTHTSACSSSGAVYTTSKGTCSSGPFYQTSTGSYKYKCTSGVPSPLYYNPGSCNTTYPNSCTSTNIPFYTASASPNTTPCTFNSTATVYGDPTCAGPYYLSNTCTPSSACNTVCTQSKLAIAKRAIFKLLDVDTGTPGSCAGTGVPDGTINSCDSTYLNIRMGYMRYTDCSEGETVSTYSWQPTNPISKGPSNKNCNQLIYPVADSSGNPTPYSKIYCGNSTSCTLSSAGSGTCVANETASGSTPLGNALQEANNYFTYTQTTDTYAACRQKFVILITDGDDTLSCPAYQDGTETSTYQYMGRRETVAQARALALNTQYLNTGFYLFAIGFGSNMPYYALNTLNWAAYYGHKTYDPSQIQSTPTTMYSLGSKALYPTNISQCQKSNTTQSSCDQNISGHYCALDSNGKTTANDPGEDNLSGYAFVATNESSLNTAINNIRTFILNLSETSTGYVAPVVPISQYQSTSSEASMYLGMFEPTSYTMWNGNIKKFGIATTATQTIPIGTMLDSTGQAALDPSLSTINSNAISYWSTTKDGGNVTQGGVGALLQASNLNSRNIYTYLGTNTDLTTSSNAFSTSNTLITPTLLGVSTTTVVQNIINFVHGWDVWDWNSPPNSNGTYNPRPWIMGAVIHSRPVVIHYGNQDVIYAGANDGMLHAFDNATGNELWGFIPPDLLPNLNNFSKLNNSLQIFVDGAPKAYVNYVYNTNGSIQSVTQATLIFGERRGGNTYTALDVTNPSDPKFLWSISPSQIRYKTTTTSSTAYKEMGQSWSTPMLGQIKNGTGTKWVAFIGGGYDNTYKSGVPASAEDQTPAGTDTSGRAVYVVDITNGNLIWSYCNNGGSFVNDSNMKYCIPSDITPIDVNGDGFIERLYVGDAGGQMWRFDLCSSTTGTCVPDMSNTASWTGKRIFIAGSTGTPGSQKIFYPPDVTFETNKGSGTYDMLFFGTGDREKPNDTSVVNSLYAIKDYDNDTNPPTPLPLTVSNLVNVTSDVLQSSTSTASAKTSVLQSLQSSMGWYIQLNQSPGESQSAGEKCDAAATVLGGAVYYTTFTPQASTTACQPGTGEGNVYILQYQTGNSIIDLNGDGALTVVDRSILGSDLGIGAGIPSGIVITVLNGTVTAYGGVAGGVFSPKTTITNSIIPLDWRIVF